MTSNAFNNEEVTSAVRFVESKDMCLTASKNHEVAHSFGVQGSVYGRAVSATSWDEVRAFLRVEEDHVVDLVSVSARRWADAVTLSIEEPGRTGYRVCAIVDDELGGETFAHSGLAAFSDNIVHLYNGVLYFYVRSLSDNGKRASAGEVCDLVVFNAQTFDIQMESTGYEDRDPHLDSSVYQEILLIEEVEGTIHRSACGRLCLDVVRSECDKMCVRICKAGSTECRSIVMISELCGIARSLGCAIEAEIQRSSFSRLEFARLLWVWSRADWPEAAGHMVMVSPLLSRAVERHGGIPEAEVSKLYPNVDGMVFWFHLARGVSYTQRMREAQSFALFVVRCDLKDGCVEISRVNKK